MAFILVASAARMKALSRVYTAFKGFNIAGGQGTGSKGASTVDKGVDCSLNNKGWARSSKF
jgi:hypothetical protein